MTVFGIVHVFDNNMQSITASHKKSDSPRFSVFMCNLGKFHNALYTSVDVFLSADINIKQNTTRFYTA